MSESIERPTALRVVRPYASETELLERELDTFPLPHVLLLGAEHHTIGTMVRFEIELKSGQRVLRAEGRVSGTPTHAVDHSAALEVRITRVDLRYRAFLERIESMIHARKQAVASTHAIDSHTHQVHSAHEVHADAPASAIADDSGLFVVPPSPTFTSSNGDSTTLADALASALSEPTPAPSSTREAAHVTDAAAALRSRTAAQNETGARAHHGETSPSAAALQAAQAAAAAIAHAHALANAKETTGGANSVLAAPLTDLVQREPGRDQGHEHEGARVSASQSAPNPTETLESSEFDEISDIEEVADGPAARLGLSPSRPPPIRVRGPAVAAVSPRPDARAAHEQQDADITLSVDRRNALLDSLRARTKQMTDDQLERALVVLR